MNAVNPSVAVAHVMTDLVSAPTDVSQMFRNGYEKSDICLIRVNGEKQLRSPVDIKADKQAFVQGQLIPKANKNIEQIIFPVFITTSF